MAFKLISKTLALISIFNIHGRAMELHPMPIYDARPDQLEKISKMVFTTIPEIKVKSWSDTVNVVMRGQGVNIQRKPEVQREWSVYTDTKPRTDIEDEFATLRGWKGQEPSDVPQVLDETLAHDLNWVQFVPAIYPINVPRKVNHMILWIRGPMTTRETFYPRAGETLPNAKWLGDEAYLKDLIEFIHAHDAFGTNVEPTKYDATLEVGENLRPAPNDPLHGYQGTVPMSDGIKAMTWSGRHITRLIQAKYPGKEFVWFRVNRLLRSFHCPNEIHLLIRDK